MICEFYDLYKIVVKNVFFFLKSNRFTDCMLLIWILIIGIIWSVKILWFAIIKSNYHQIMTWNKLWKIILLRPHWLRVFWMRCACAAASDFIKGHCQRHHLIGWHKPSRECKFNLRINEWLKINIATALSGNERIGITEYAQLTPTS